MEDCLDAIFEIKQCINEKKNALNSTAYAAFKKKSHII